MGAKAALTAISTMDMEAQHQFSLVAGVAGEAITAGSPLDMMAAQLSNSVHQDTISMPLKKVIT